MKKHILLFLGIISLSFATSYAETVDSLDNTATVETVENEKQHEDEATHETVASHDAGDSHSEEGQGHHAEPAAWSIIPFVLLLLMIAIGPLFFEHFWHKNYPLVAIGLGLLVIVYYLFFLDDSHHPIHAMAEYVSFIALIASLFVASGGILIKIDKEGQPWVNLALLVFGAFIANIIGTTGASMLLIRPFIRLNQNRIKAYHIVFFIFMVSNVGGCLTPIGDPPLFLGFLKGVPFFWTVSHLWEEWIVGIALIGAVFFFMDSRNKSDYDGPGEKMEYTGKITMMGAKNLIWLAIVIGAVFLDPNKLGWLPGILHLADGHVLFGITDNLTEVQKVGATYFSVVREIIMFTVAILAYKLADKDALKANEFDFEPVKEVAFIFVGIFATMMPALQLVGSFAMTEEGRGMISVNSLYWATGSLSGVLDNAPTYMNFLSAGMGKANLDIGKMADVTTYVNGNESHWELMAISVAAVFFGAMTYIGNAPNFMVKSIAEQAGVKMPAFVTYIVKYSLPILLPILGIVWVIFFWLKLG